MNSRRIARNNALIPIVFAIGGIFIGCADKEGVKMPPQGGKTADATGGTDGKYDPSEGYKVIDPRPKVSAFGLDDIKFHVGGVRIGMQAYMNSETPVVSFFRPPQADYVEILRCKKDTPVQAGLFALKDIEIGVSTPDERTKILTQNDFWAAAEKAGCILTTKNVSDQENFIDSTTRSGGFRWLVRACVDRSRLEVEGLGSRNCSRQVSPSPVVESYDNNRNDEERLAIEQAMQERDKIDGLGRAIYYTTVRLNNAIAVCEEREAKRLKNIQREQATAQIIGQGIGLAANFYTAGAGGGGDFNWTQAAKSTWDTAGGQGVGTLGGGLGGQIAGAISDLFLSDDDIQRSCSTAEKLKNEGKIFATQLKASHELFAIKMDQAKAANQNRQALEK